MSSAQAPSRSFLDSKWLALFVIIASIIPLLLPTTPPLTDLPGHIARYRIELDLDHSAYLRQWYDFHWALFGNLGVDLLVVPLAQILPLETAVKLIVLAIPPLTMLGMLYLACEIHGRVPPTALFALPLAYCFPFQLGFVNFTLSMALAFVFAGLWLNLGRLGQIKTRAALFAVLSPMLFLAHAVGWGIFGVIIFSAEVMGRRARSRNWLHSLFAAAVAMLPLTTAFILILIWAGREPGGATLPYPWYLKLYQLKEILRDQFRMFDILSAVMLYALAFLGIRRIGVRYEARLGLAAILLAIIYWITPGLLKGVFYADTRMLPYFLAVALIGLTPVSTDSRWHRAFAVAGLAFFVARMVAQFVTYHELDRDYQRQLVAIDHIDRGSRVFVMVYTPCEDWGWQRMMHLGSLATARRESFTNGMWPMPGGRLMTVTYAAAAPFQYSPTQVLQPEKCRVPDSGDKSLREALTELPRQAFDYVWLIDLPPEDRPHAGWLKPVWHGKTGILYRIVTTR